MPPDEIRWIVEKLENLGLDPHGRAVDAGSESEEYRRRKPHILDLYSYLRGLGLDVETLDADPNAGADHTLDVTADIDNLGGKFGLVLCTSTLEHVEDVQTAANHVKELVQPGGILVVTVPQNTSHHPHPIDNGFRPTEKQLEQLLGPRPLVCETFPVNHYQPDYLGRRLRPMKFTGAIYYFD